ncbi:MAG: hypothetical protein GY943_25225 [Chloroflexi bacterium]|nr:hypothetical protein [Chloroflexota bacterium]
MNGNNIIVLSGNVSVDDNWRRARHGFKVADVFDKGDFADEEDRFKQIVNKTVANVRMGKGVD